MALRIDCLGMVGSPGRYPQVTTLKAVGLEYTWLAAPAHPALRSSLPSIKVWHWDPHNRYTGESTTKRQAPSKTVASSPVSWLCYVAPDCDIRFVPLERIFQLGVISLISGKYPCRL